ncbi:MAG: hypothetical protein EOM20_15275 [Spartobacteria bacterium]|nr:hypothetical protein [Spartobacteria bacterium]
MTTFRHMDLWPDMLTRLSLTFRSLPAVWDGLRIAFLADLHFKSRVLPLDRKVMKILCEEEPDVVILGGDNVNRSKDWPAAAEWFGRFPARLAKMAVPGNWEYKHKYKNSIMAFCDYSKKAGFVPLRNASFRLERDGVSLPFVGFDDVRKGIVDPVTACRGTGDDPFVIAVSHSPDILLHLPPEHFNLLLCGHTHGGQVRVPGYGAIVTSTKLGKRFEVGRYTLGGEHEVYVSRGIGTGDFHWRLFCPPEVVMITLRRGGRGDFGYQSPSI